MKILFVCTGNICRSPTAHGVLHNMATQRGLDIFVDSAGTHAYHVGQAPDARSAATAKAHGYDLSSQSARQVTYEDFEVFDHILCMDQGHVLTLMRVAPPAHHTKIKLFDAVDVGDPYYGGDAGFEKVFDQIERACERFLATL